MIKKTLIALATLLITLVSSAQSTVGEWKLYPVFANGVSKIIETPNKVYYLSEGNLFSYSDEDNESFIYSTTNKLSDNNISNIYYNKANKYLLVTYTNGNIDFLYDNGKVVNMPELKDAFLTTTKDINDVAFGSDRVVLATNFGIVVINDQRHEVVESGNYNQKIDKVLISGNHLLIYYNYTMYHADLNVRHNTIDKFASMGGFMIDKMVAPNENMLIVGGSVDNNGNSTVYRLKMEWNINRRSIIDQYNDLNPTTAFNESKDGFYASNANGLILIDTEGNITTKEFPQLIQNQKYAYYSNPNIVWAANEYGIAQYDLSDNNLTLLADKIKPDALTCKIVAFLIPTPNGNRIYATNLGPTAYKNCGFPWDGTWIVQTTNIIENGSVTDVSLKEASAYKNTSKAEQNKWKSTQMMGGSTRVMEDPDDPSIYYCGNNLEGIYVIKDGVEIGKYDGRNMPITPDGYADRLNDIQFDVNGNMWVGHWTTKNNTYASLYMLPAAKRRLGPDGVVKADWIPATATINKYAGGHDLGSVMCKKSNMMIRFCATYNGGISVYDTKGTYDNLSDDTVENFTSFIDQDGKSFSAPYTICAVEDQKGRVWVGTSTGVIELTNPADFTSQTARINRIKVPRNDGTNFADYLLDTDQINDISVDPSNRKWIATEASGVYLVSENGDCILEHYTTDNSILPSNQVFSVQAEANGNRVYFGTAYGIVSYSSNSSPASDDYSNVYAYPNPVRPDYTGWITIKGLMNNSLVKIADAAGNVLFQTRSEGGMVTWDGCNANGARVKSGVYYVLASQNQDGNTGVVTKILVVN